MATIENQNQSTFVAPEGVYSLTEEHKSIASQNIVVNAGPLLYATRIASVSVRFPPAKQGGAPTLVHLLAGNKDMRRERPPDGVSLSSSETPSDEMSASPMTSASPGEAHNRFSFTPAQAKKKATSRPKHNMRSTSSTFVTRIQSVEGLSKTLQSKQGDVTFLFYNIARTYLWAEAGSKSKEPLTRITFSAYPTCHDVNLATASPDHLDIIIGFNSGDIIWLDPIASRYTRLNKQPTTVSSPCTSVRWVPSSSTLFLASFANGTIVVYDKEREDGTFVPQDPSAGLTGRGAVSEDGTLHKEWNPLVDIFVTMPPWHPATVAITSPFPAKYEKDRVAKNPVSHWRISQRSVVDFMFSPDTKYIAAISEDGCLRVIDAVAEHLVDCYASYFGTFTCVAWSPDSRFILTGGQDDLLTIFSPGEQRVIARCQGHSSFISAVSFDDLRCDGRTYRFGSVGQDNKMIMWDFSSGVLHRPKIQASHNQRVAMSSTISLAFRRDRSMQYLPSFGHAGPISPSYHPAPSRHDVSVVQPVLIKHIEGDLLTDIAFIPRCVLTVTKSGHVKVWVRPLALKLRVVRNGRSLVNTDAHDVTVT